MSTPEFSKQTPWICPSVDRLRAYVIGQLSAADSRSISEHLDNCAICSSLVLILPQASESLLASLRQSPSPTSEPPPAAISPVPPRPVNEEEPTQPHDQAKRKKPESLPAQIGRYLVLGKIGSGGFGVVYLGHDLELDRLVAIKVPHLHRLATVQQLEAYQTEARLLAALDHPHIVPVYDVGRTADVPFFIVSKFIQGHDLSERIKHDRPDFRQSAELMATLAEALDFTHAQGLIHCDIKPKNILLDGADKPHIMDFGLARRQQLPNGTTGNHPLAGTPAYMSPEQAKGDTNLGPATDIYSLGVVLFELLTGTKPFQGEFKVLRKQIANIPAPLPRQKNAKVPRDLEAICAKAMAKAPEQRYARAAELAEDLRRFGRGEPSLRARRVSLLERAWVRVRRNRVLTGAIVLAALAFLLAGLAMFSPPPAQGP